MSLLNIIAYRLLPLLLTPWLAVLCERGKGGGKEEVEGEREGGER